MVQLFTRQGSFTPISDPAVLNSMPPAVRAAYDAVAASAAQLVLADEAAAQARKRVTDAVAAERVAEDRLRQVQPPRTHTSIAKEWIASQREARLRGF